MNHVKPPYIELHYREQGLSSIGVDSGSEAPLDGRLNHEISGTLRFQSRPRSLDQILP